MKYARKIGEAFGMPYGTREERQELFEPIADCDEVFVRGTFPKLANWLMWNMSANEHWQFFWVLKMILDWAEQDLGQDDRGYPHSRILCCPPEVGFCAAGCFLGICRVFSFRHTLDTSRLLDLCFVTCEYPYRMFVYLNWKRLGMFVYISQTNL